MMNGPKTRYAFDVVVFFNLGITLTTTGVGCGPDPIYDKEFADMGRHGLWLGSASLLIVHSCCNKARVFMNSQWLVTTYLLSL